MKDYSRIIKLAEQNNGYVLSKDVNKEGISRDYLKYAVEDGIIDCVKRGIYILKGELIDDLFVLQQNNNVLVYSAFTSAYLHNLTTRDSEIVYGTVPKDYNSKKLFLGNQISRETEDIYNLGVCEIVSVFGNKIRCHDIHRTVCDLFSKKYSGDKFAQIESLKNYVLSKEKNLEKLMAYANELSVYREIKERVEVLLQ